MNLFKNLMMIFVCLFVTIACASNKGNILYVGTNAEFPPFEYLEEGELTGFDIDIIHAIGQELGMEVAIENLAWDGLLPALQGKKIDVIIAGFSKTEDRAKVVDFSDTYYISKEQKILINGACTAITDISSLTGKKVGVVLGFTGDMIASEIEGAQVERFNNAFQAIQNLKNQKVDAVLLDNDTAIRFSVDPSNEGMKVLKGSDTSEEYVLAVRKRDSLKEKLNRAIKTIQDNGTYDQIYEKYFSEIQE
ncbi:MAG: basic amino acid ABC transporter substrate-binding protein [Brevinema sp.]